MPYIQAQRYDPAPSSYRLSSCRPVKPWRVTVCSDYWHRRIISALSVGSEWNEGHEASHLLSHHHLPAHADSEKMKLPSFLRIPKIHRRTRSRARSEIDPIEGQNEPDPAASRLRPTESTPDLRIGTPTLPTPSPWAPHDQESGGMLTTLSRTTRLSTLFRVTQTRTPLPIKPNHFPGGTRAPSRNLLVLPLV